MQRLEDVGDARQEPVAGEAEAQERYRVVPPGLERPPAHPALRRILYALACGGEHADESGQEKKAFGRTEEAEALVKVM